MTTPDIIAIGGLLIALVSLITGFILQRDTRKIKELERDNKKFRGRLLNVLNAIKGYQVIVNMLGKKTFQFQFIALK